MEFGDTKKKYHDEMRREDLDLDEVFQCWFFFVVLWCDANDLKTLIGISKHIRVGLFFVSAATWCKDGKSG